MQSETKRNKGFILGRKMKFSVGDDEHARHAVSIIRSYACRICQSTCAIKKKRVSRVLKEFIYSFHAFLGLLVRSRRSTL